MPNPEFSAAFRHDPADTCDRTELLALRISDPKRYVQLDSKLYVPIGADENLSREVARKVETHTNTRIGDIIPIDDGELSSKSGLKLPENTNELYAVHESAGFDNSPISCEQMAAEGIRRIYARRGLQPNDPNGFSAENWSVCIVKPDAKDGGLESMIREHIEAEGLDVLSQRDSVNITEEKLEQIWPSTDDNGDSIPMNPWWQATIDYMTSAPVDVMLVHGEDASDRMKAIKGALRTQYYGEGYQGDMSLPEDERVKSVIHTSDCDPELELNARAFWNQRELARIINEAESSLAA